MRSTTIAAALLGLGASTYAQSISTIEGGITYAWSIPSTTSSSGSGDVYIQISGPTTYSWIGMGSGSQMSGSHMFVIYQNAAGTNVTLSPRTASGEVMPTSDSSSKATLTAGSGVSNGVMTANILCPDCSSNFEITSSKAPLIYAALSGSMKSDDVAAKISQHGSNSYGTMSLDMTKAVNSANTNPFASSNGTSTSTGTAASGSVSCVKATTTTGGSSAAATSAGSDGFGGYGGTHTGRPPWATGTSGPFKVKRDDDNGCPAGYVPASSTSSGSTFNDAGFSAEQQKSMLMAHGIMAGLAFAVFFPFGAISIRLMSFPGLVAFHAIFQIAAYLFYIIAFGLGIALANQMRLLDAYHPIIGILLFVLLFFQPILGWMHHNNFKKFQQRTMPSFAHVWLGRVILTLGIINGGLGFMLADNTRTGPIAYGVIAAIFFAVYVYAIIVGEKRRKRGTRRDLPPKYDEVLLENSPNRSPTGSPQRHREFYGAGRK